MYICSEESCKKKFRQKNVVGFKDHLYRHSNRFDYSCDLCGNKFTVKKWYVVHLESHSEVIFNCYICSKSCKKHFTLSQHMKSHFNPRKYKCDICGKECSNLKEHQLSHTNIKNIYCYCGESFLRKQDLYRHIPRVHTGEKK